MLDRNGADPQGEGYSLNTTVDVLGERNFESGQPSVRGSFCVAKLAYGADHPWTKKLKPGLAAAGRCVVLRKGDLGLRTDRL